MSDRVGRFQILGEVARGATGAVFRAREPSLGREVAIKVLLAGNDPRLRERFRREATALARLRHPGVVSVIEAGEHEGRPFLVMELIEGRSLHERLRDEGPLDGPAAAHLGVQLAETLAYVHAQGLLHRDLKPGNVLLAPDGRALLTDFGLVRQATPAEGAPGLSRAGTAMGTPGFWAPEQALGLSDEVGPRSDLFGLGAVLYACLTRRAPHEYQRLEEYVAAAASGTPPPRPSTLCPELDPRLEAIVLRCLAHDPPDRFASALELAEALRGLEAPPGRASRLPLLAGVVACVAVASSLTTWLAREGAPLPVPAPARSAPAPAPASSQAADPAPSAPLGLDLPATLAEVRRQLWVEARPCGLLLARLDELESGVTALDERAELALTRATVLGHRGRYREGLAALPAEGASPLRVNSARAHLLLGLEQVTEGLVLLDAIGREDPEGAVGLMARATALTFRGPAAQSESEALARRAIALAGEDDARDGERDPRVTLGFALSLQGRRQEAQELADQLLSERPGDLGVLRLAAQVRHDARDLEGAWRGFGRVLELTGGYPEPRSLRRRIKLGSQLGRWEDVRRDALLLAQESELGGAERLPLALALLRLGDEEGARRELLRTRREHPRVWENQVQRHPALAEEVQKLLGE